MSAPDKIRQFIMDELLVDDSKEIVNDTSLFETQLLDSLNLLSLIAFLEETFSINISPSEISIENMDTIANMTAFIEKKKNQ